MLVYRLIQEFLLRFICTYTGDGPPQQFIDVVGEGLEETFGHVDVTAVVQDFAVDEFTYLSHGVIGWAVEFEGFAGGGVVHGDFVEGFTYVDDLGLLAVIGRSGCCVLHERAKTVLACG